MSFYSKEENPGEPAISKKRLQPGTVHYRNILQAITMKILQRREFCFLWLDSRMDTRIKLQMAEGPLSLAGEGGFPSRPFYHQGLIRIEMKTSILDVFFFFSCVTVVPH